MKKITAGGQVFGPYETVETMADRYRVNGAAEIPFSVIGGAGTIMDWGDAPLPTEAPKPPDVPEKVTRRQGLQQLYLEGITLEMIHMVVEQIPDEAQRALARIEVDESQDFERNRPLIGMMWAAFGRDPAELDGVFIRAAKL